MFGWVTFAETLTPEGTLNTTNFEIEKSTGIFGNFTLP